MNNSNKAQAGWLVAANLAVLILALVCPPAVLAGEEACGCKAHFEYRSCSGSRTWCGFDTYQPTTPKTKYLAEDVAEWVGTANASGAMVGYQFVGLGGYLPVSGTVVYNASGDAGWIVWAWKTSLAYAGSLSAGNPTISTNLNGGAYPYLENFNTAVNSSGSVGYTPFTVGHQVNTYTNNCVYSNHTLNALVLGTPPLTSAPNSTSPTSKVYSNISTYLPASRTHTLSVERTREAVEQDILSINLASCPTGNWKKTTAAGSSTLSGNTITLTKVEYRITLVDTKPLVNYLVTWTVLVYDESGNEAGEEYHQEEVPGTGFVVTTTVHSLLPPLGVGGSKRVDESSLQVHVVGGSGCCGNNDPGNAGLGLASVDIQFPLGQGRFGRGGGQLYLRQQKLDSSSSTPAALQFAGDTNSFEVLTDAGEIRQVRGLRSLAHVVTIDQAAYELRFYSLPNVGAKSGGFYTVTNTPYVTWTIRNPDGAPSTNRLQVVELRGAYGITNEYQWAETNQTWTFISGNGLRTENKATTWDSTNKIRSEITKVFTGSNELVSEETRKFKLYSFGMALSETRTGPTGAEITSTNTYYTSGNVIGQLNEVTRSDGSWEKYSGYDTQGRVTEKWTSSHLNQGVSSYGSTGYRISLTYGIPGSGDDGSATNSEPRTIETRYPTAYSLHRQYLVRRPDERIEALGDPKGSWSTIGNLFTTNRIYTNGPFSGFPKSTFRPDGTATVYFYETNATTKTTTVLDGQPDPADATNILDGTKTVTIVGLAGQTFSNTVFAIPQTNVVLSQEIYSDFDDLFRARRITYLDGTYKQVSYDCCNIEYEIERDGTRTDYGYDDLKRRTSVTRNGITTFYTYDGAGRVTATSRQGTDTSTIVLESSLYDTAGRLTARTNALNQPTLFAELIISNQLVRTTTNPDGGTITNWYGRDNSLLAVSGTATAPLRYEFGIVNLGSSSYRKYTTEIRLDSSGGVNEWTRSYVSPIGVNFRTEFAAAGTPYPFEWTTNNLKGLITNRVDADGVITKFLYNGKAELEYSIVDSNRNHTIDYGGLDRITRTVNDIVTNSSGFVVRRASTYLWSTNGSAVSNLVSSVEISTDGLRSWNTVWNNGTPITSQSRVVFDAANGYRYVTNIAPDSSYSVAITRYGTNVSVTAFDSLNDQLSAINYGYDSHGRQNAVTDARTGTTTYTFNDADQVLTVTTPDPDGGGPGTAQTTTMAYDNMSRVWKTTLPDNTSVTNEFYLTGLLKKTYGSRTYPVEYTYDAQGRMKTMKTWKDFAGNSGTATTTWSYDSYRGWLTIKVYDGGAAGPVYTYTAAGRLATRAWARGTNTTYSYNYAGDLMRVNYSDSTPDVGYGYNRLGWQTTVTNDTTLVCTFAYNSLGQMLSETYSSGPLSGLAITNGFDSLLRRSAVALNTQPSTLSQYGYDTASRLASITNGSSSVDYGYLANSPLVSAVTFQQSGTTRLATAKSYDNLNRLTQISSTPSADAAVSFNYQHNPANQRVAITNADSSRWVYTYDKLGQVVSGKKYWSDGTPVAGQQFEYTFDDIGNRKTAAGGGDQFGLNLRSAGYTNNSLNQVTSRGIPGYVDILGSATNTATVTVNNQATYRKGDYFRAELTATNSSPPWFGVTNVAVLNNGTNADIVASTTGFVFVAQSPETFSYDPDGNLTNDGRWTITWDAENRATSITRISGAPSDSKIKLDCQYDYGFRRIEKVVSGWNGSAYVAQNTNRFIYDGWNLVTVLSHTNGLLYSFAWGLDASGTMQEAGGVGGLVSMTVHSGTNAGTYFYAYDGNHNIVGLVNATNGQWAASYEYEPFGRPLRATGPLAFTNPFLFSTKFHDWETGFYYYGYRYYDPSTGRWLGRDPLEELGGANLYSFVFNGPTMYFDVNGDYTLGEWAQIGGAYYEGLGIGAANVGKAAWGLIKSPYTITKSLSEGAGHLSTQYGRQRFGEQLYLASQLVERFRRDECFRQRVIALLGDEAKIYFTDPYKLSELFAEVGVAAATAGAGAWAESANGAEKLAKFARLLDELLSGTGGRNRIEALAGQVGAVGDVRPREISIRNLLRQLSGDAKNSEWATARQSDEFGIGIRDHFIKHGDEVGAASMKEYDLSARLTMQHGKAFRYHDPTTLEPRIGYWDAKTGLFTGTSTTGAGPIINTHFPLSWPKIQGLPGFSTLR